MMEFLDLVRRAIQAGPDLEWFEEVGRLTGFDVSQLVRIVAPEDVLEVVGRKLCGEGVDYFEEVKPLYERLLRNCVNGLTEKCKYSLLFARWLWELIEAATAVEFAGGFCRQRGENK